MSTDTPWNREDLGRVVREAWIGWARTQSNPKPTWLVPWDQLGEADREADMQIGEAARLALIGDAYVLTPHQESAIRELLDVGVRSGDVLGAETTRILDALERDLNERQNHPMSDTNTMDQRENPGGVELNLDSPYVLICSTCGAQRLGDASVERGTDPSVSADDVAGILAEPSPEPLAYLAEGSFSGGSGRLRCAMLHPPLRADLYSVTPLYAHPAGAGASTSTCASGDFLISAERRRQIEDEGWAPEHNDLYLADQLVFAAVTYAFPVYARRYSMFRPASPPETWPWATEWWKPTPEDRIRELTKAGALIAAEIDRLLRAQWGPPSTAAKP